MGRRCGQTNGVKKEQNKNNSVAKPPRLTSRNAARERSRVRSLRSAFQALQDSLPAIPRHTKLSKLDVLVLAASYIAHLSHALDPTPESPQCPTSHLHPVRKWPMRSRLYAGVCGDNLIQNPVSSETVTTQDELPDTTITDFPALDWDSEQPFDPDFTCFPIDFI